MAGLTAYIGPGAGIGLIGALLTFIGSIGFALLMVMLHPIRNILKRRRASAKQQDTSAATH